MMIMLDHYRIKIVKERKTNKILRSLFMALIPLWAVWGMWYEKRHEQGAIRLGDEGVGDGHLDRVLPISEKDVVR
jgi:hypothetical protein